MMGWARIDDGFYDHPKVIGLSLEAVGLWTKCLTWVRRHGTCPPGFIPEALPQTYAGRRAKIITKELVDAELWEVLTGVEKLTPSKLQRTPGWVIHDYEDYLSAAERSQTASSVSKSRSEAGRRGAQARWGVTKGSQADGNLPSDLPSDAIASANGKPMPPNPYPYPNPNPNTSAPPLRDDVETICDLLADRVHDNGVKRPTITDAWRQQARLLIDTDGYPLTEIIRVINWCQDDVTFWAGNIQAMPKLRKQFGQLLVKSRNTTTGNGSTANGQHLFGKPGEGKSYY